MRMMREGVPAPVSCCRFRSAGSRRSRTRIAVRQEEAQSARGSASIAMPGTEPATAIFARSLAGALLPRAALLARTVSRLATGRRWLCRSFARSDLGAFRRYIAGIDRHQIAFVQSIQDLELRAVIATHRNRL